MPSFNFSLVQKEKKRKTSNYIRQSEIIEKNVTGVVWINSLAEYSVHTDSVTFYFIHKDSYSCKGKKLIYRQGLDYKGRTCIVRNPDDILNDCDNSHYLPFAPGCCVSGDIVKQNGIKVFLIKKVWTDLLDNDSHEALNFYRERYKEINQIIKKKRNGV